MATIQEARFSLAHLRDVLNSIDCDDMNVDYVDVRPTVYVYLSTADAMRRLVLRSSTEPEWYQASATVFAHLTIEGHRISVALTRRNEPGVFGEGLPVSAKVAAERVMAGAA